MADADRRKKPDRRKHRESRDVYSERDGTIHPIFKLASDFEGFVWDERRYHPDEHTRREQNPQEPA